MMSRMVRPLESSDTLRAARVLSLAFRDDPFFAHIFQSADAHMRHAPWLFESWLRLGVLEGASWVVDSAAGVVSGAMLCHAPDARGRSACNVFRSGMALTPFKLPWPVFRRLYRLGSFVERRRAEIMRGEQYWYCQMLGVDPAMQGSGVGSALLRRMLAQADEHGRCACYLETGKPRNAAFYSRFGFEVHSTQPMDDGAWTLHFMRRPARA